MQVTETPETGLINWSNAEYHADTSRISKSGLDKIAKSPSHYYYHYLNTERPQKDETPAMRLGTAIHCAILEPDQFPNRYAFLDDAAIVAEIGGGNPRVTAKYKAWKAAVELENVGKIVLSAAEYASCNGAAAAVWAHPLAAKLLKLNGPVEQSYLFTEPVSGAPCKIRVDKVGWLGTDLYLIDVKSTEDASEKEFGRSAVNYDYPKQAAFYFDGYRAANGFAPTAFVFIAVEKTAPFNTAVYFADDEVLALGREQYVANCKTYAQCRETNNWPGYSQEINNLKLPAYAFNK